MCYKENLIAFEGIDGSGKSTCIEHIKNILEAKGKKVIVIKNIAPNSIRTTAIRNILDSGNEYYGSLSMALLYLSEMAGVNEDIKERLKDGYTVLLDRWVLSTIAYAGKSEKIIDIITNISRELLIPDATIYLDVNPAIALGRIKANRGKADFYENIEKQTKIRDRYMEHTFSIDRFDNNGDIEDVKQKITERILNFIGE